ncbi:hypothetical protein FS837_003124 [Tulasnella sp. UAMH 9824]|nr:hypothetical protein FS837_003124 [Tulasnella sp. UAMH 9824]
MASNEETESGVLQFQGKDAQECEEFISAVKKHAYDHGKQRDDEWIADLVATCLTHNALRWWSGLDKGTRGSWERLREAMFSRYQPRFYGKNGEEAEEFVYTVRQRARDAGKQKDNDWIITLVSDCFVGDALRWHVSLDRSIRGDWELLQWAILAQYPREGGFDLSLKMPTPAPATSAPPKLRRARVHVRKSSTSQVFLSKIPGQYGLKLTSSVAEALVVEYDPSINDPQTLLIPDSQIPNFDTLGARWKSDDTTSGESYAFTSAINSKTGSASLVSECTGPQMKNIWVISSTATAVGYHLQVADGTVTLITRTNNNPDWIWFKRIPADGITVDLFLDPI